jgi:hypothetical protein
MLPLAKSEQRCHNGREMPLVVIASNCILDWSIRWSALWQSTGRRGSGVRAGRLLGKPRLHKRLDDAVLVLVARVHLLVDGGHIVQGDPARL